MKEQSKYYAILYYNKKWFYLKKYQFIPFRVMGVILLLIVLYRIGSKNKLDIIKKDFNNPQFIIFLFFVKTPIKI